MFYVAMSACDCCPCFMGVSYTYKDSREEFMIKLRSTLGESFKEFEALDNIKGLLLC